MMISGFAKRNKIAPAYATAPATGFVKIESYNVGTLQRVERDVVSSQLPAGPLLATRREPII